MRIVPESERPLHRRRAGAAARSSRSRRGCAKRWAKAPSCAWRRAAASFSSASKRRARAIGSAFRCRRARRPKTIRRAPRCGASCSRPCCWPRPSSSRAISRARCASSPRPSSASAAARRPRRCPSTARRKSSRSIAASTGWPPTCASWSRTARCCSRASRMTCARRSRGCGSASRCNARDEATRAGMVDDIEEMDRIIGQFLEFARTDEDAAREPCDPNAIVARLRRALCARGQGRALRARNAAGQVPLRPTAFSRLVTNLVDNAIAYGAPPVEVTTRTATTATSCSTSPTAARASRRTRSSG